MSYQLLQGDCRAVLAAMDADSLDACVTDPPYELTGAKGSTKGFMGKEWDGTGVAFDVETWRAVYRVLKPGAHLIAFGGTRTYHRMTCAIEDAGFEVRDCIAWAYATGFPKSMSVPLAIDKMLGVESADVGTGISGTTRNVMNAALHPESFGGEFAVRRATSPEAQAWEGFGTALKPSYEPCVVARKPLRERSIAAQVLATGTGAIDIDRCRISAGVETPTGSGNGTEGNGRTREGGEMPGTGGNVTPPAGRWPANLLLVHAEGCEPKGARRVKGNPLDPHICSTDTHILGGGLAARIGAIKSGSPHTDSEGREPVIDWRCVDGCPVRLLGQQSGESHASGRYDAQDSGRRNGGVTNFGGRGVPSSMYEDDGDASRFFAQFHPFYVRNLPCLLCGGSIWQDNASSVNQNSPPSAEYSDFVPPAVPPSIPPRCEDKEPEQNTSAVPARHASGAGQATARTKNESIVRKSAQPFQAEWSVRHAASAVGLCGSCGIGIAQSVAAISQGLSPEWLHGAAFISGYGRHTLLRSLALAVDALGSTATTPTTTSLQMLFGFVRGAIVESINRESAKQNTEFGLTPFRYEPKASRAERDAGCESLPIQSGADLTDRQEGSAGLNSPRAGAGRTSGGRNTHATVKPVEMMRYLVRLVTPPGGTCLDPFMGSGTTGVACVREERAFVGIELLPEHMAIAEARIKHATAPEPWELPLFADLAPAPEQTSLFAPLLSPEGR